MFKYISSPACRILQRKEVYFRTKSWLGANTSVFYFFEIKGHCLHAIWPLKTGGVLKIVNSQQLKGKPFFEKRTNKSLNLDLNSSNRFFFPMSFVPTCLYSTYKIKFAITQVSKLGHALLPSQKYQNLVFPSCHHTSIKTW